MKLKRMTMNELEVILNTLTGFDMNTTREYKIIENIINEISERLIEQARQDKKCTI